MKKRKMTHKQLSSLGGKSGRGKAKARPAKVARAAAMARWLAYRAKQVEVLTRVRETIRRTDSQ